MISDSPKNQVSLGKALVFKANDQKWACELGKIKEIVRSINITPLPNSIETVAGVINVRGDVVPVVTFWPQKTSPKVPTRETVIILKAEQENIGLKVEQVASIEDIHAYDLGSTLKEEDSIIDNIISCHVYLSESEITPLIDVKLIIECIKAKTMPANQEIKPNFAVSSPGGKIL